MRYFTFLAIFCCGLAVACSKKGDLPKEGENGGNNPGAAWKLAEITFSIKEDDVLDSVFSTLDTYVYRNNSLTEVPDFSYEPYKNLLDSMQIETADPEAASIRLSAAALMPDLVVMGRVVYTRTDTVSFDSFRQLLTVPVSHRIAITERMTVPAKTKVEISGEYWRVRYSVSFRAEIADVNTGERRTVNGKIRGSRVATGYYAGQTPAPKTTIIHISEIKD